MIAWITFLLLLFPSLSKCTRITCYSCRASSEHPRDGCNEPFDASVGLETKKCLDNEKCAKITGRIPSGPQKVWIRGCYLTNEVYWYIKETTIRYKTEIIEGDIHVCEEDYCNSTSSLNSKIMLKLSYHHYLFQKFREIDMQFPESFLFY